MRSTARHAGLALSLVLIMASSGLTPRPSPAFELFPRTTLAANETVTDCVEASFDAALRAVQDNGGGTVRLECSEPITFHDEKNISGAVTIIGNGETVFDGNDSTRLFWVERGARLELIGVTLQRGSADYGGAIYNAGGQVVVTASKFYDNAREVVIENAGGAILNRSGAMVITASTFSGNQAHWGGAILNNGTLTITASTFSGNQANWGGAIYSFGTLEIGASTFSGNNAIYGGAIQNYGLTLTVTASTFAGNSATAFGGALVNSSLSTATITASTFLDNTADLNGGVVDNNGTVTIATSILANTTGSGGSNCSGFIPVSGGSNLSDDGSCGLRAAGDIENSTAINLDELKDNGGPTHTVLPLEGSDAIGNADCAASTDTDQRGVIRPQAGCEIGAVELGEVPVQIVSVPARGGLEGQPVPVVAVGSGPAGSTLSYAFDCAADGSYAVPGESYAIDETSASYGLASCAFPDDGEYPVGVQICMAEPALCHTAEFIVQIRNVAPTIEHIALDEPIIPGQPVTLTVTASDPAREHDPLSYAFDCNGGEDYEPAGPTNHWQCPLDPSQANTTITVLVADDDGGSTTGAVIVRQSLPFCANRYTGQLGATLATGSCPPASTALTLPAEDPETLCIQRYTGELTWSPRGACSPAHTAHMVPDDGPLTYCQNRYTGTLRYAPSGACSPVEQAGIIPGLK